MVYFSCELGASNTSLLFESSDYWRHFSQSRIIVVIEYVGTWGHFMSPPPFPSVSWIPFVDGETTWFLFLFFSFGHYCCYSIETSISNCDKTGNHYSTDKAVIYLHAF